jgi:hypothetical protein
MLRGDREKHAETSIVENLRRSNVRLESLLHEANHRVANSLQLISSLVHMHTSTVADPTARMALKDTQQRLQAVTQLHRTLYTGDDVDTVAMEDYLAALVSKLRKIWSTPAAPRILNLSCEEVRIGSRQALFLPIRNSDRHRKHGGTGQAIAARLAEVGDLFDPRPWLHSPLTTMTNLTLWPRNLTLWVFLHYN